MIPNYLVGNNFGTNFSNILVTINGLKCTNPVTKSHYEIQCNAPVGTGLNAIMVEVNGLYSRHANIKYLSPVLVNRSEATYQESVQGIAITL